MNFQDITLSYVKVIKINIRVLTCQCKKRISKISESCKNLLIIELFKGFYIL